MERSAEIIAVGTELLIGDIVNTNAAYISKKLAEIGIPVYRHTVVGDNPSRLKNALDEAFSRVNTVIITGGLGPTSDDITKETVACYFDRELILSESILSELEALFNSIGKKMSPSNEKQAYIPKGAFVFRNSCGTAPGMAVSDEKRCAVMVPGVPFEMKKMIESDVIPYLAGEEKTVIRSTNVYIHGIGESAVEDILGDIFKASLNPSVAPYCGAGEVRLRITARESDDKAAEAALQKMLQTIMNSEAGRYVFYVSEKDINTSSAAAVLCEKLREKKLKIGFAESCTGGLTSKLLTDVPGASDVFLGSVVSYNNSVKSSVLGVKDKTLSQYSEISEQCAAEMASGCATLLDADVTVSITGVAGPGGYNGFSEGYVCFGVFYNGETKTFTENFGLAKTRDVIRNLAAVRALHLALEAVS